MLDKNFKKDVRISLLAALSCSADKILEKGYYSRCWEGVFTDDVMVEAIDDDGVYLSVLEAYLLGQYSDLVTKGLVHLFLSNE